MLLLRHRRWAESVIDHSRGVWLRMPRRHLRVTHQALGQLMRTGRLVIHRQILANPARGVPDGFFGRAVWQISFWLDRLWLHRQGELLP